MYNNAKEAIKELSKKYEELYLVTNYLTDRRTGEMINVWNIYAKKEDALRWPVLCVAHGNLAYPDYEKSDVEEAMDDGKEHVIMTESYTYGETPIDSKFVYQKVA